MECWLPVVGYEEDYRVSDLGRVMSLKFGRERMLKLTLTEGYPGARLARNGVTQTRRVHGLVLSAFVGPRPEGMTCNHKDGDRTNNALTNLEWIPHRENLLHAMNVLGRRVAGCPGELNIAAKLTQDEVDLIRFLYSTGVWAQAELALLFGVGRWWINRIVNHKAWTGGTNGRTDRTAIPADLSQDHQALGVAAR